MMPEYGHALLCLALGVALLLSVYPLWGVARGDADDGVGRGVRLAAVHLRGGRVFVLVHAFVVNDFTVAYVAGNSNTQLPVVPGGRHRGARGLAAAVGAADERLDPGGGGVQPAGAGGYRRPGAGGDGDGLRRFSGVHPVHLRPVRPHAAGLSGGGARPESAAAGPGADFPPAAAVHGLCRLLGGLRLRHRRAAERASGQRVHPFCPPVDAGGVGVPDAGYRARLGVGLLRAGLGRLVVLGPGGERLLYAVAGGHRPAALAGGHGTARRLQGVDAAAVHLRLSLCLLGTFLVRSGVLVSVHAFASDPARGMFILAFMVLVTGGSLLLFAVRGHRVRSRVNNALWSRESLLLGNNVLLMAAMLVVLLGTLLPLVHKQLGSISVGSRSLTPCSPG